MSNLSKVNIAYAKRFSAENPGISLEERLKALEQANLTDHLTGLYNQCAFDRLIKQEVGYALRNSRLISLIVLDLNQFKRYNDEHGHPAGDARLKEFAEVIQSSIRPSDFGFRIGGDEFAVLLREIDGSIAQEIIRRIRKRAVTANIGFSSGHSTLFRNDRSMAELVKDLYDAADKRMYQQKQSALTA